MGTIKFELELPEFDNEINISLTIKKDGEVVGGIYNPSALNRDNITLLSEKTDIKKSVKEKEKKKETTKKSNIGGNFMNLDGLE